MIGQAEKGFCDRFSSARPIPPIVSSFETPSLSAFMSCHPSLRSRTQSEKKRFVFQSFSKLCKKNEASFHRLVVLHIDLAFSSPQQQLNLLPP
eukprot:215529-Pleurochrysis_carterae.AAC.1